MSSIHVYWDESHFWGLLVTRTLSAWGLPYKLVRGHEIADGALSGKRGQSPRVLIVPGGRAKGKTDKLGLRGMDAICDFVHRGGTYLGICGGTGLALTGPYGLGLSPWTRKGYQNRLHHFLSGHVTCSLHPNHSMIPDALEGTALLPVWWPGRFDPVDDRVTVLARYKAPGPDFWVADLHLATLPDGIMDDWASLYGVHLNPDFLVDLPCVTMNTFGKGQVILSYAHLETPASPMANQILSQVLSCVLAESVSSNPVPSWNVADRPVVWDDTTLRVARVQMEKIIETGVSHFLLFWRNPWLIGWRRGLPGAGINSLYSLICEAMACEPDDDSIHFWESKRDHFSQIMDHLVSGLTGYLLAERLSMTVFHSDPNMISKAGLMEQRRALFGKPPEPGGLYAELVGLLEELYWHLSRKKGTLET